MKARTKKVLKRVGAAALVVGAIVGVGVWNASQSSANEAATAAVKPDCVNLMYPLCNRSVAAAQVVDNSLPGYKKLVPNSVSEDRLSKAVQDKLNKPATEDTDNKGALLAAADFEAKEVAACGGSFKTNKTLLGSFTLPAGKKLMVDSYMFASRSVTGPVGTHAQLALRIGATEAEFGADRGTIFQPLPPTKGREVTGTAFWTGDNPAEVKVDVFAFCYNDDQSAAGAGQWTASAKVKVTQG
jgi:hypothetical protein